MAARKIRQPKTTSPDVRAFTVVLEEIHGQNEVFGEGLQLLREQMTAGFEEMNRRFEQVDHRFDHIEQDLGLVKIAVLDHSRELKEIRVALDKKVDGDEVEAVVQRVVASGR
jgi:hypothetical protein